MTEMDETTRKFAIETRDKALDIAKKMIDLLNSNNVDSAIALLGMSLVMANTIADVSDRAKFIEFFNGGVRAALADIDAGTTLQ